MPTENRSSNTEMVSVPAAHDLASKVRETLDRQACPNAWMVTAYEAVVANFPQPAPQPHPEPIAWMVGTAIWWTKEEAERDAAETGLQIVGLGPMSAVAPEQHRGEPVAWMDPRSPQMHATISNEVKQHNVKFGGAPASAVNGYTIPLYTHADPGEVERLREGMKYESERAALCLEELQECESQRDEFYAEITGLRAQPAERDALLCDIKLHGTDCFTIGGPSIRERIDAAVSASAEPSEPIAWHVGGNGYDRICFEKPDDLPGHPCIQAIHDQRQMIDLLKRYDLRHEGAPSDERQDLTDEQIIEAMRPDLNSADGGYVVDTSPNDVVKAGRALLAFAEPSAPEEIERAFFKAGQDLLIGVKSIPLQGAPAEIDERAAFESWYIRDVGIGLTNLSRINSGGRAYEDEDAMAAWEGWQARSALERKPS